MQLTCVQTQLTQHAYSYSYSCNFLFQFAIPNFLNKTFESRGVPAGRGLGILFVKPGDVLEFVTFSAGSHSG